MPPTSFFRWLVSLAPIRLWAMILLAFSALMAPGPVVWVLVYGAWPIGTAQQRIAILGFSVYGLLVIAGIGMAALATVKVHAKTIAGEITVEGDDDDHHAPTAEATVTVKAGA